MRENILSFSSSMHLIESRSTSPVLTFHTIFSHIEYHAPAEAFFLAGDNGSLPAFLRPHNAPLKSL